MVKKFSDWIKTAWKNLGKRLSQKSKKSFQLFLSYETITLKLYLEILEHECYEKIIVVGEATKDECFEAWEKIIRKNYEVNGGFDYINYMDLSKSYTHLLAESNIIRASLLKLIVINLEIGICFAEDDEIFVSEKEIIDDLLTRGYKIDVSNKESYRESLYNALRKVENINSRIKMKSNEINKMFEGRMETRHASFEEIIAGLSFSLGFQVSDDITLSRFNEYKKIIHQKYAA